MGYYFELFSKKQNISFLAPIEVEILLCRGSAQKIATESGTTLTETPNNISASKNNNQFQAQNQSYKKPKELHENQINSV